MVAGEGDARLAVLEGCGAIIDSAVRHRAEDVSCFGLENIYALADSQLQGVEFPRIDGDARACPVLRNGTGRAGPAAEIDFFQRYAVHDILHLRYRFFHVHFHVARRRRFELDAMIVGVFDGDGLIRAARDRSRRQPRRIQDRRGRATRYPQIDCFARIFEACRVNLRSRQVRPDRGQDLRIRAPFEFAQRHLGQRRDCALIVDYILRRRDAAVRYPQRYGEGEGGAGFFTLQSRACKTGG